jgi:methylenetetrahydrofolate dehydrogenase (NADP+)/methenyltetrahydrofolate cyclohydrolase
MELNVKQIRMNEMKKLKRTAEGFETKPTLTIIQVKGDKASDIYVRNKIKTLSELGIKTNHKLIEKECRPVGAVYNAILDEIAEATTRQDFIILQLPLPKPLKKYEQQLLDLIPERLDVDRLSTYSKGKIMNGDTSILPCTVQSVIDIIGEDNVAGGNFLIFGRSQLVGMPLMVALTHMGGTAKVVHTQSRECAPEDRINALKYDAVITAVGQPFFIDCEDIVPHKGNLDIIDVSINNFEGNIVGDLCGTAHIENSDHIHYTPVPNGVGILTTLNVAKNIFKLFFRNKVLAL